MYNLIDLTGLRFGRWVVLRRAGAHDLPVRWHCRCDCGVERAIISQALRRGASTSCGCVSRDAAAARRPAIGSIVVCPSCTEDRTFPTDFPKDKSRAGGYRPECKQCHSATSKARYRRDPSKVHRQVKAWRAANRERRNSTERVRARKIDRALWLFKQTRRRAVAEGIPFDLEPTDITIPVLCPVLGIPLTGWAPAGTRPGSTASIDKIIPTKGYVKGNVCVISMRANAIKYNATLEELEAVAAYVRRMTNRD